jgi:hypothetical protein
MDFPHTHLISEFDYPALLLKKKNNRSGNRIIYNFTQITYEIIHKITNFVPERSISWKKAELSERLKSRFLKDDGEITN